MSDQHDKTDNEIRIGGKAKIGTLVTGTQINADKADDAVSALEAAAQNPTNNKFISGEKSEIEIGVAIAGTQINIGKASDLAPHVEALAKHVDEAAAAGELDQDQAQDAHTAIARVQEEIKRPQPAGKRVVDNLKKVTDIFDNVRKTGENAVKIGKVVVKAAPYAAMLWQAARTLFGI